MIEFDHIAVAAETLAVAQAHVEGVLGVAMQAGGEHAVFHTHNMLLGLEEGLYLESIANNPDAPRPDRARWFDLDRFVGPARLSNWICRCADLDATLAALPEGFGAPVSLQRGDLRWRMAVPESGILPFDNCAPALMEWEGSQHPAAALAASGARLENLHVSHPEANALEALLAPHLSDQRIQFSAGPAALAAALRVDGEVRMLR
ncbi:VOC family protein [Sulfitobacter sp. F26204]|uniref:VOC family protein n=1 Tax=Sulfitobacter sp. F26204 TaxID=2996014 RepID=UPI00225E5A45|nr:VOC family protein [Sulfitobacter sp. F26204]MCX7559128.1 VOC family protein [Sulfitobacter sp. F26204]